MKITVAKAAEITGGSERWVRSACERHLIGDAWGTGKRKAYLVVPEKLASWLGITLGELEARM